MRWSIVFIMGIIFITSVSVAVVIHVPGDQPTIQAGIDTAVNGDTVLVADGTYTGDGNRDIEFNGKSITVMSANGPASCVIDCEGDGRGFYFRNDEGESSIVQGFTVQNGHAEYGGGIRCYDSSPTITNCTFTGNWAYDGGGIHCTGDSPTIANCVFTENAASNWGGGINFYYSNPTITNCVFTGNMGGGGGIGCYESSLTVTNCSFTENTAIGSGGGIFCFLCSLNITNCTFTGNTATGDGGGIEFWSSNPTVTNCILWNDIPNEINGSPASVTYSCIQRGYGGVGNIDVDPLFVTGPLGGFYLSQIAAGQAENSPCLDTGSDLSENICFMTSFGEICMSELTTRTDEITDTDIVDMGFHYFPSSYVTPTPIPTQTPTPRSTATSTSTPIPIPDRGMELILEDNDLVPGDLFYLHYYLYNPENSVYFSDVWIILEVSGSYWFFPTWIPIDEGIDFNPAVRVDGLGSYHEDVLNFTWPEVGGQVSDLHFYGAAFFAGSFTMIGNLQVIWWGYN